MGRGRGKGKKLAVVSHEDGGSGEEEKVRVPKRRGRPQKPLKDDIDELEELAKIEEDDSDNKGKETNHKSAAENGTKRKRNSQAKDKQSPVKEVHSAAAAAAKPSCGGGCLSTPSGFRHSGSRRKSTPHRAAEAGVKIDFFFSIESSTGWNQL